MAGSGTSWPGTSGSFSPSPSGPTGSAWRPSGTRGRSGSGTPAAGGSSGPSAWAPDRARSAAEGLSWSPDGRRLASAVGGRPRPDLGSRDRTGDGPDRRRTPDPWPGARTGPGSPRAGRDAGLEVRPWDARDERLRGPVLRQPGDVHCALLVARRPPAGRHLGRYRQRLAQVGADRLGHDERGEGIPGGARHGAAIDRLQPRRHPAGDGREGRDRAGVRRGGWPGARRPVHRVP